MSHTVLISIFCPDQKGLVAGITGYLFDLGANLGDTNFAVLGGGAEFTTVCEIPISLSSDELQRELGALDDLDGAEITIQPFALDTVHGPSGQITHRITIRGGDQPGLIARLSETFIQYQSNIVRLSAEVMQSGDYVLRLSVNIPPDKVENCLSTVANTAEGLQLSCKSEEVS